MFLSIAGTEEQEELTRALGLIKDTIVQVDTLVNLHEKNSRLRDIHNKMEPKALGKIKDGRVFRREDFVQGRRRLLHDGTVNWKAASGRLKGIIWHDLSDLQLWRTSYLCVYVLYLLMFWSFFEKFWNK